MKKKLKDSGGLTVVEMLCATLILSFLCMMMGTGISMAMKTYHDMIAESEAQMLLSSLSSALSDRLYYAVVTESSEAGVPSYSLSIGEIKVVDAGSGGRVVIEKRNADGTLASQKFLLPEGAYGNGRYQAVTADVSTAVETHAGGSRAAIFTVTLEVREASGTSSIGAKATLTVRCLNPVR